MIVALIAWWYGSGWKLVWRKVGSRSRAVLDMFSVTVLAQTLFAPFRQIDAGFVNGPIGIQLRAWFDRTFSRVFGAVLRSIMIFTGLVSSAVVFVGGAVWALVWPLVPLSLPIGVICMLLGVGA